MNSTLISALELANRAFQFYLVSDICIKDLAHDELYTPLKELVYLLQSVTNNTTLNALLS